MNVAITCELAAPLVVAGQAVAFPPAPVPLAALDLSDAEALVCLLSDRVDAATMARAPRLRVIANYAVGTDNIDIAAATALGICVLNTPDVLSAATAELAFALMLAVARRLGEGERLVRAGQWQGWHPTQLLGVPLAGRRLGIVGMGRIGRQMAQRALGFGMEVAYAGGRLSDTAARAVGSLDELFAQSDVISLHCPLTPTTRLLVNAARLALLPAHGIVVNTARGDCVDEAALLAALDSGRLFGAGLDVFTGEPQVNPALRCHPRVVCAPHLGSATVDARAQMVELLADGMAHVLAARPSAPPRNLVNPNVWAMRRGVA